MCCSNTCAGETPDPARASRAQGLRPRTPIAAFTTPHGIVSPIPFSSRFALLKFACLQGAFQNGELRTFGFQPPTRRPKRMEFDA
jgi:hypothetical protein